MTLEEIIAKANNDPEFRKGIVMYAKDTAEGKELLENHANAEWEKKIGDKISEVHKGYDNDIFEVLGQRKKGEQKTYDFIKELAAELKKFRDEKPGDKDSKIKELEAEVKELKEGGEINDHWKGIYEEARQKWEERENELNETIQKKDEDHLKDKVISDLNLGRSGLKYMEGLPKEAIDAMVASQEASIIKHAKLDENGKIVYYKEDGTPWMNEEIKPISAEEIWKDKLGSVIDTTDKGNPGGGAPAKGGNQNPAKTGSIVTVGEGDSATKKLVLDKSTFSTREEFQKVANKVLSGQGITADDPNFNKMKDAAYVEYEVGKLDLQ
jgi:hypothetical protein